MQQQLLWEDVVQAVHKAVAEAARREKPLRKRQHQLVDDILVLVLGLRPSFLIDYARATEQALQGILQQLDPVIHALDPGRLSLQS